MILHDHVKNGLGPILYLSIYSESVLVSFMKVMRAQLDAVRLENRHLKEASFQGELKVNAK
jgi:hypothetical protein